MAWLVYLAVIHAGKGYMIASFLGAVFCGLWSELWARRLRQPATVFLISAVIPLIPGNALYQTMNSLVTGEMRAGICRHGNELCGGCLHHEGTDFG